MKKRAWYIVGIIHFLLSFIWERSLFHFSNNWDTWTLTVMNDEISGTFEIAMVYCLSKVMALVLILLLWKIFFYIVDGKCKKDVLIIFGAIFLVGMIIGIISFPEMFGLEVDNYGNFSKALRFQPNYWQSIYTSIVYAGSMMVIPHPFGIFCIQWTGYVLALAYLYTGVDRIFKGTKWKYAIPVLLVLPESYFVMQNAYRNDYYTILCLFYFGYLYFALVEKRDHSFGEMLSIALLSGFLMVWRSEGIFIGLGGMFLLLVLVYRSSVRKIGLIVICFVMSFFCLNKMQGIGAQKYFGNDYVIVNTTNVLCSIFNDPDANLDYEGVKADLAAIEAVVPVAALKEKGLAGYRSYNYSMGHGGFNQSLAEKSVSDAYIKAFYSIVAHNLEDYFNVQFNYFFSSMGTDFRRTTYKFTGEKTLTYEKYSYESWKKGRDELKETLFTKKWEEFELREKLYALLKEKWDAYRNFWNESGLNGYLHLLFLGIDIVLVLVNGIMFLSKRNGKIFGKFVISGIILAEFMVIFLFMPEGRPVYLYPMLFASYVMTYLYILGWRKR